MKKRFFKWALLLAGACVAIVVLNQVLPYSQSHFRRIYAVKLKNSVKEWQMLGRPPDYNRTNRGRVFLFERTVNVGGNEFHGFMRMEGQPLSKEGYLLANTNSQVLWCDANGCRPLK